MAKMQMKKADKEFSSDVQQSEQGCLDELELEAVELKSRVRQWLKESAPPDNLSECTTDKRSISKDSNESQETVVEKTFATGLKRSKSLPSIKDSTSADSSLLYHPDFSDWRTCYDSTKITPDINGNSQPRLLDVLSDAHSSISQLLQWNN